MKISNSNRFVSSKNWVLQVFGALLLNYGMSLLLILVASGLWYLGVIYPRFWLLIIVAMTLLLCVLWYVVKVINAISSLRKEELRITISQIVLLCAILGWIGGVGIIIAAKTTLTVPAAIITLVLTWIFQDIVKSVVAFFYLRINGLLQIDDWIEVPSKGVDGMVRNVNLASVTIENWDTTTSSIPTYILNSDHFRNNQRMMDGKTYGRMMKKTFILDTGWIRTMKDEEFAKLKVILNSMDDTEKDFYEYYINNKARAEKLNAQLYRQYIYHWLMHNENVSHEPRLIVRWLEQTPEGMPLQVYVFLTSTSLAPFEWQQSLIIERIIESLAWFNLQLYQSPSGFDASNSNVYLAPESAKYKKNQSND